MHLHLRQPIFYEDVTAQSDQNLTLFGGFFLQIGELQLPNTPCWRFC
jgi:hypothetical protein